MTETSAVLLLFAGVAVAAFAAARIEQFAGTLLAAVSFVAIILGWVGVLSHFLDRPKP